MSFDTFRAQKLDHLFAPLRLLTVGYLKSYRSQLEAYTNLDAFFRFYNEQRPHSAFAILDPKTPLEVYRQPVPLAINQ